MNRILIARWALGAGIFGAGLLVGANASHRPKTVIHYVTLKWKDGVTEDQKKQLSEATDTMASKIPGIRNVWTNTLKVQGKDASGKAYDGAFAMEFESQSAFEAYVENPAHKDWEKVYLPLRGQSTTSDVTN